MQTNMHLAIDLRFYRPEPFGIAVHIRDLFAELLPLLQKEFKFEKVTLIFDRSLNTENLKISDFTEKSGKTHNRKSLNESLSWFKDVRADKKFNLFFSKAKYYSVAEQTTFYGELKKLDADLVYFFTFNYPILYKKPFVYQVLDLTHLKMAETEHKNLVFRLKTMIMKFILKTGLQSARHRLLLGSQTPEDIKRFLGLNVQNPHTKNYLPSTVIWNGLNKKYLNTGLASSEREPVTRVFNKQLMFSLENFRSLADLKNQLNLTKPYFLFLSVWKKHKNILRLVEAFEKFTIQTGNNYQLVIAGRADPSYLQLLDLIYETKQYKLGNIILAQNLTDDQIVNLQDGAEAFLMPSLSEGMGLTLVEAAVRGTPVICSKIQVFLDVMKDGAIYFDPLDTDNLAKKILEFTNLSAEDKKELAKKALYNTKLFRWETTAEQIMNVLVGCV